MKLTITNTDKVVTLHTDTGAVQARIWEGISEAGVKVECFITRVAVKNGQDMAEFERELAECAVPTTASWPARMIL